MDDADGIEVEVAYASRHEQRLVSLRVKAGASVEEAIRLSHLLEHFPDIDLKTNRVGIFGRLATLATPLRAGDRVEIYRPLTADPKEARRRRASSSPASDRSKP